MSINSILDRIISRKKQATLSTADAYLALVRDIATGSEVDADHAAELIESFGKDASDFEKDIALMQRRFEMASQVAEKNELQKILPALEREAELAKQKLNEAIAKLQPIAIEAERKFLDTSRRIEQFFMAENQLSGSCMDQTLLNRESEIHEKRREIVEKLRPLQDDLRRESSYLRGNEMSCVAIQQRLKEYKGNHPAAVRYREDLARDQALVESGSITVRDLQQAVDELNAELSQLNNEMVAIAKAKLVP
jgi:hypothetical protein